jgi:hypothetical protein
MDGKARRYRRTERWGNWEDDADHCDNASRQLGRIVSADSTVQAEPENFSDTAGCSRESAYQKGLVVAGGTYGLHRFSNTPRVDGYSGRISPRFNPLLSNIAHVSLESSSAPKHRGLVFNGSASLN